MDSVDVNLKKVSVSGSPRVLVLLATYNSGDWLKTQVDSILAQEEVEVYISLGDDVSGDNTRQNISKFWGDSSRVQIVGWETASGSAGSNFRRLYRSADISEFDFVALADQDDVWFSRKLINAVMSMRSSGAQGYSCAVEAFWSDGRSKVISQHSGTRQSDFLFEGAGQGCTFVMEAALFKRVRDFCIAEYIASEALHYHDWLIYLLSRIWGMSWFFDSSPQMRYRQHDNNEIGSRGSFASISKRLKMIENGWYRGQIKAALQIVDRNGGNAATEKFSILFHQSKSPLRRLKIATYLMFHSRRRATDRIILVCSAIAGWI